MNKIVARAAVIAATAGAAIAVATGSASASADNYGAIAISTSTGAIGWSYDYASQATAESVALGNCNAADCSAVVWFANGCGAVSKAPNGAWGWGYAASRAGAEAQALSHTEGANAEVVRWVCTTGHQ